MRRAAVVCATVSGLLLLAVPASADELEDLLERASEAEFSGTKFVHCETPDGLVSQVTDIKQSGGVTIIRAKTADYEIIARRGEVADQKGDYSRVATVSGDAGADLHARYEVEVLGVDRELGRRVTEVLVLEADVARAEFGFDAASGAVLRTETFNAVGTTYCTSEFIAFTPGTPSMDLASMESAERTELVGYAGVVDESRLPSTAGGFTRVDVYAGPTGTTVAYYSDGVFSMSVVTADSPLEIPELTSVEPTEVAGAEYRRIFFPGQVVFLWETPEGGYALVTDAPLDMQTAVLSALPRPGRAFFLARWWQALTGR